MKPFNLKQALQGKPVLLRDGSKAYVLGSLLNCGLNSKITSYPLRGVIISNNNSKYDERSWTLEGKYYESIPEHDRDIIGMYNESTLTSREVLEKAYKEGVSISLKSGKNYQNVTIIGKTYDNKYIALSKHGNTPLVIKDETLEWELDEFSEQSKEDVILDLLKSLNSSDIETDYEKADTLLCDLLTHLGYEEHVEAWKEVKKWYA